MSFDGRRPDIHLAFIAMVHRAIQFAYDWGEITPDFWELDHQARMNRLANLNPVTGKLAMAAFTHNLFVLAASHLGDLPLECEWRNPLVWKAVADEAAATVGCPESEAAVFLGPDARLKETIERFKSGGGGRETETARFGSINIYLACTPGPAAAMLLQNCPDFCRRAVLGRLAELPVRRAAVRVGS